MEILFGIKIHGLPILAVVWNLFLAFIPVFIAHYLWFTLSPKKWNKLRGIDHFVFWVLTLVWLFFFPNTAYLFTEVRHLVDYCTDPNMYRVCELENGITVFFLLYSLVGVPTFYYSLKRMSQVFGRYFSKTVGAMVPVVVIPATSIGVMLGLFERFNSWEIVNEPLSILMTGLGYFTNLLDFYNFAVYTIALFVIYYFTELFLTRFKA